MKDYFGTPVDLRGKKLFLFDMDGTIYKDDQLFDGTLDLFAHIRGNDGEYVFITNNSSKSVHDYVEKVTHLGIPADASNFYTSSQAAAQFLKQNYTNAKIYCLGTKALVTELRKEGIQVTENVEHDIDAVLVGFDTELTSDKLRKTCEILTGDVAYFATNPDLCCPVVFGFIPDCGSICAMLKNCTGKEPVYFGKPSPKMAEMAMERFHVRKDQTVVVGDRLYTDIATGLNAGVDAVCVLTGEATPEDIRTGTIKPTWTFSSVKELFQAIQ